MDQKEAERILRQVISQWLNAGRQPTWLAPLVKDAQQLLRGPAPERPPVVVPQAEDQHEASTDDEGGGGADE